MADVTDTNTTEHVEPVDTTPIQDADTATPEPAPPTPVIAGSCSNPNWQPTQYEPYQP